MSYRGLDKWIEGDPDPFGIEMEKYFGEGELDDEDMRELRSRNEDRNPDGSMRSLEEGSRPGRSMRPMGQTE